MKEVVLSASENTRVVRLGNIRYDYRVEKFVAFLLDTVTSRDAREFKRKRKMAVAQAIDLGWKMGDNCHWRREG
jgi:hypothetical protein